MENSLKALFLAAAVAVTLTVITMGFFILKQAQGITKSASEKMNQVGVQIDEAEFTMYDQTEVSGTEVVNVVRKYKEDRFGVYVKTLKNSGVWLGYTITEDAGVYTIGSESSTTIAQLISDDHTNYINPNGQFKGVIIRNANGSIIGLKFSQK